ncbi:MAG: tetratricopeptide repeat protein [Isosphaeraceae bacterium]
MTQLIYVALICWLPFCLLLFTVLPPHRAVIIAMVGGWVVLPPAGIPLPGLPDCDKVMVPVVGATLGTLIFQPNRLLDFRPRWFDLPAFLWCLAPLCSSLANGLGVYDGLSGMLRITVQWTVPYLIGRLYFGNKEEIRDLATGIAIGGMVLVLPCLFEMRMSPLLSPIIYGVGGYEGVRLGGWRPRVFFTTGLELGMWMTASSLTAAWLWWSKSLKEMRLRTLFSWVLPVLILTTMFCRATGALVLLFAGLTVLAVGARFRTRLSLCALLLVPPLYYSVRIPNLWSGTELTNFISTNFNEERGRSLAFRFEQENKLVARAMLGPVWGWGGWGRSRVRNDRTGRDDAPTDGMWIIYLGINGCTGLLSWTTMLLLPSWLFTLRFSARQWRDPTIAPLAALATLLGLYVVDCLVNGFLNISYVVACGGLAGAVASAGKPTNHARKLGDRQNTAGRSQERKLPAPPAGPSTATRRLGTPAVTSQERLADRYRELARTLRAQGQPKEAKAMLSHALQLLNTLARTLPESPGPEKRRRDCANDLAWLILSEAEPSKSDLDLAVQLARQSTQAEPDDAVYWNTLGAALDCAGEPVDAIAALERSMALSDGGTGHDYVFLALAHLHLGQADQARHWLDRTECWINSRGTCPAELQYFLNLTRDQMQPDRRPLLS